MLMLFSLILIALGGGLMLLGVRSRGHEYLFLSVIGLFWMAVGLVGVFFALF